MQFNALNGITNSSLGKLPPNAAITTSTGYIGANGMVSLIPSNNPIRSIRGELLYLDGQFGYHCMTELLYAAKSGATRLRDRVDNECRQEYLIRQSELKRAGKPYDTSAPVFDVDRAADAAYWQSLVERNISMLRGANRFAIRFSKLSNINKAGQITVFPFISDEGLASDYVIMVSIPEQVPVDLDAESANRLRTNGTDLLSCDAVWEFFRTVDNQTGYNYGRYEVQFKTVQIGCREALPRKV